MRQMALQWAEYHHLIGADHIWIYVNEDWNDAQDLPQREYISWIPFSHNLYNYKNFTRPHHDSPIEFFRMATQVDSIWRARRMGLEWLSLTDVDEYIEVVRSHGKNNATDIPTIDALAHYMKRWTASDPSWKKWGGIQLNSIPFGRNREVEPNEKKELRMDYVWREDGNPKDFPRARWKAIIDPQKVIAFYIHYVAGSTVPLPTKTGLYLAQADELRINHYKKPDSGVYWKNRKATFPGPYTVYSYLCCACAVVLHVIYYSPTTCISLSDAIAFMRHSIIISRIFAPFSSG